MVPAAKVICGLLLGVYKDDAKVIAALERIKDALIAWQEEHHV